MARPKQAPTRTISIRIKTNLHAAIAARECGGSVAAYFYRKATEGLHELTDILCLTPTEITPDQANTITEWLEPFGIRMECRYDEAGQKPSHRLEFYPALQARDGIFPGADIHPWRPTEVHTKRLDLPGHRPLLESFIGGHLPVTDLSFPSLPHKEDSFHE